MVCVVLAHACTRPRAHVRRRVRGAGPRAARGYEATVEYLLPLVKQLADDAEVLVRQSLVRHFGDLAGFLIQSDPERGYQKAGKLFACVHARPRVGDELVALRCGWSPEEERNTSVACGGRKARSFSVSDVLACRYSGLRDLRPHAGTKALSAQRGLRDKLCPSGCADIGVHA